MADAEVPPVDDYKDDDNSDYMLNAEDDLKQTGTGMEEVNGAEIFDDVGFEEVNVEASSSTSAKIDVEPAAEVDEVEKAEVKASVESSPAPVESSPAPVESSPAPVESSPAPVLEDKPPTLQEQTPDAIPIKDEIMAPNAIEEEETKVEPIPKPRVVAEPDEVFDIIIQVSDPHKVGDGMMNSYMAYKVKTKTSLTQFKSTETKVDRRFSDFLGLHEKLLAKHRHVGHIVPPAPEKSVVGMTLVKISKTEEEAASIDFVEKRRAALERYMNRLVRHAPIIHDQNLIDFLEQPTLPQSTNTRALSGAGVMRFVKNMEGALNKMTIKMVEEDAWFEEKQQQVDSLEAQLKKLHTAFESLVHHRKDLAVNTALFAKSSASLGNAEEHTSLSRALAQLSDSFEKLELQHQEQANKDFFHASEIIGDYLRIIEELKEIFMVRVKAWQAWKQAEQTVQRKREQEMKIQASGRTDKLSQIKAEINDLNDRVEQAKKDFEKLSASIRKEVGQFEKDRIVDFQKMVLIFLKNMMKSQEQSIKTWEAFLPEARAIA